MSSQDNTVAKKKRGRPATGEGTQIGVRCHPAELAELDHWRSLQPGHPPRGTAIRSLMILALKKSPVVWDDDCYEQRDKFNFRDWDIHRNKVTGEYRHRA